MGSYFSRKDQRAQPNTDFYPDKIVKYAVIVPILLLAIIALICLYGVDRIKCSSSDSTLTTPLSTVNEYCWNNLRPATQVERPLFVWNRTLFPEPPPNTSFVLISAWEEGSRLDRHKLFPILLLCECACLAIPLLIWYWCVSNELRIHTRAVINHANSLTTAYQKYDRSQLKSDEVSVHRELDNYLEYLSYLLTSKARRLYIQQLLKWVVMLIITIAWFGGNLGLVSPDFMIFGDRFKCLYDSEKQITYDCYFPTSVYLRVLWYINIVILGILIIVILLYIITELCLPRRYRDTYFHTSVPGTMDYRLEDSIQTHQNSRHYWLLSRLCEENDHLCTDPGLAKSLARKYGRHDSSGHSGYGEKPPVFALAGTEKPAYVKQGQVDRFRKSLDRKGDSSTQTCSSCCGRGCFGSKRVDDSGPGKVGQSPRGQNLAGSSPRRGPPDANHGQSPYMTPILPLPNGDLADDQKRLYNQPGRANDYSPDHLYFRELARYKYPNGINPEYPIDYPSLNSAGSRQVAPSRQYVWQSSPGKVYYQVPIRGKRKRKRRQQRPRMPPRNSDIIVLEDLENPRVASTDKPAKATHSDEDREYESPYGGTLSSRVLVPYYDPESRQYKDLNPLAYKIRQHVRKEMARGVKIWKP